MPNYERVRLAAPFYPKIHGLRHPGFRKLHPGYSVPKIYVTMGSTNQLVLKRKNVLAMYTLLLHKIVFGNAMRLKTHSTTD